MKQHYVRIVLLLLQYLTIPLRAVWFDRIDNSLLRFNTVTMQSYLNTINKLLPEQLNAIENKFLITDIEDLQLTSFKKVSSIDALDVNEIAGSLFVIFFHTDDQYKYHLEKIISNGGIFYAVPYGGEKTRYVWTDKNAMIAINKTFQFADQVSHLTLSVHEGICHALQITKDLAGDYVEVGVYKGGSALTALHYMQAANIRRQSYFIDTFEGMNYQEAHDSVDPFWDNSHALWGKDATMAYIAHLLKTTEQPFHLVQANICRDCLPQEIEHIAVCNLDVDVYEATLAALLRIAPRIVSGGIIISEDPTSTPMLAGALLAMEQFLETSSGKKFVKILCCGQYFLIKLQE